MSSLFRSSGSTIDNLGKLLWPQMRSIATSNAMLAEKKKDPKAKTGQVRDPEAISQERIIICRETKDILLTFGPM